MLNREKELNKKLAGFDTDLIALHYAREIFKLKENLIASGLDPVAHQLAVAIDMLDEIWLQGSNATEALVST